MRVSMIDLYKQDLLKQLSDEDYQQWCNDLMIIKRIVIAINRYKRFKDIFDSRLCYYLPNYSRFGSRIYSDESYDDPRNLANDFLYGISVLRKIDDYYPLEYYPLYLRIFIDCVDAGQLTRVHYDPANISPIFADRLNDCMFEIHQELRKNENRIALKRVKEITSRQRLSVEEYIDRLILCFSRLLVVRVDFGYCEDADTSYELISKHRDVLLRYLREKHDGGVQVGYIWKLEYGLKKGYHLHMMIFLNGSLVQESISHGKLIANHWIQVITEGKGVAFNCNAIMSRYQRNGIGRVDYYDIDKINALKFACEYLTKYDEYIELVHYGYQTNQCIDDPTRQPIYTKLNRVFGKAKPPTYIPHLGRPRSKGI